MSDQICCVCGGTTAGARCSGCSAVAYCSPKCQAAHWPTHKQTCATLPRPLRHMRMVLADRSADITKDSALCTQASFKSELGNGTPSFEGFYGYQETVEGVPVLRQSQVVLNDALFVQLIAAAQGQMDPAVFAVGRVGPWTAVEKALKERSPGLVPGMLAPSDSRTFQTLQRMAYPGRWLLGPDERNRYLGITPKGPMRLNLKTWHSLFVSELTLGLTHMPPSDRQLVELLLIDDLAFEKFEVRRAPADDP